MQTGRWFFQVHVLLHTYDFFVWKQSMSQIKMKQEKLSS